MVAVTSLHPDHLTWHAGDIETYYADKLSLCTLPGADLTVANGDSPELRPRRASCSARGSSGSRVEAAPADDWTAGSACSAPTTSATRSSPGPASVALGVDGAADDDALGRAPRPASSASRAACGRSATVDGVLFVDDSLSTNVLPTLAAVDAFPGRRVAVIVGGQDRGIDYGPLVSGLAARPAPTLVVITESEAAPRMRAAFDAFAAFAPAPDGDDHIDVVELPDLDAAARVGRDWAQPDGVVLLSPAAPSFDRFRDYRHRAETFAAAVGRLTQRLSR